MAIKKNAIRKPKIQVLPAESINTPEIKALEITKKETDAQKTASIPPPAVSPSSA
ncbi:MAG: hypothetical protein Q8R88_15725 [Desulfoprunum sp.]|nr:hypothetical protein [Desulfoprunum sp.]